MEPTPQELEIEAVKNKHERARKLAEVPQPKRRSVVFKHLTKLATTAHEMLIVYDLEATPDDYAEVTMEIFQSSLSRLHAYTPSPPAAPSVSATAPEAR